MREKWPIDKCTLYSFLCITQKWAHTLSHTCRTHLRLVRLKIQQVWQNIRWSQDRLRAVNQSCVHSLLLLFILCLKKKKQTLLSSSLSHPLLPSSMRPLAWQLILSPHHLPSHLACAEPPAITIKAQAASQLLAPRYVANKKPGL